MSWMTTALMLLLLAALCGGTDLARLRQEYHWPSGEEAIGGADPDQTCTVSKLAYQYGLHLQPHRAPFRELFDALELHTKCGLPIPEDGELAAPSRPLGIEAVHVDAAIGDDLHDGSEGHALKTVAAALEMTRARGSKSIVLRGGVHYLNETMQLGTQDSGLSIVNYPGEVPWLSGGKAVDLNWQGTGTSGVYKASISLGSVPGLNRLEYSDPLHARMTRARHPNKRISDGTMEHSLLQQQNTTWLKPPGWGSPGFNLSRTAFLEAPTAAGNAGGASHYTYGVGGWSCGRYTPSGGFWCSNQSSGGGSGWELMVPGAPLFPVGLSVGDDVFVGVPNPCDWESPSGAVIETWTNGWATTFWEVDDIVRSGPNCTFVFGNGGQQTGRGFHVDPVNPGGHGPINTEGGWKVENAFELLDAPEEFFFNASSSTLYLMHNSSSGAQPESSGWVVPVLKQLVSIQGPDMMHPANQISIQGVGFRDSVYTYLDEWGIPSGGDWALHRGGALFVESAEEVLVQDCQFTLLDGNALFLSGYTRNVTIVNNTFSYIGDNAMAAWGYTSELAGHEAQLPPGTGIDGTSGEQPRFTSVLSNVVREIGLNERQSSAWSEAKACQSHVKDNVFFNLPRAAINKNDGFGGGSVIEDNLLTNTCRESGDHGNFNSWDRQPFLTDVLNGSASLIPANNTIRRNFLISNYGAGFGVDNDDTSSYYLIHDNFFYLGGGVKCDYDGHEKHFYNNLMLGSTTGCWHTCAYAKGFPDYCYNNTIIQATNKQPSPGQPETPVFAIIWFCNASNVSQILPDYSNQVQMGEYIHSNTILNAQATATVTCGYSGNASATTVPLSAFTDAGLMKNTVVGNAPQDHEVMTWARELLGMVPDLD